MYCFHAPLHEVFCSAQHKNHDENKYYCDCTDSEFQFVYKYLYNALYTRRNSSKLVLLENILKKLEKIAMLEQCGQIKAALESPAGCERVGNYAIDRLRLKTVTNILLVML